MLAFLVERYQLQRLDGIDAAKGLAIFCVVVIHTGPFLTGFSAPSVPYYVGQVLQQLCSWAVPFFFTAAGFFFSRRATPEIVGGVWLGYTRRLVFVLVVWIVVNGVLSGAWVKSVIDSRSVSSLYWNLLAIPSFAVKRPDLFFFRGTSVSLWFLVSLLIAITVLAAAINLRVAKGIVLVVGALAYLGALLLGQYSYFVGLSGGILLEHRGPLVATAFVALGYYLARHSIDTLYVKPRHLLVVFGALFVEALLAAMLRNSSFQEVPYLLLTFPLAALMLVRFASLDVKNASILKHWCGAGRHSLGIYLVHIPILGALAPYVSKGTVMELLFPILLFLVSYWLSVVLQRIPYIRQIVA